MADIAITAANVKVSNLARLKAGVAAGNITRGQPVYFDTGGNGYKAAKANAIGGALVEGVALNDAGLGQNFQFVVKDPQFTPGGAVAAGDVVSVSGANAGGITKTPADITSGMVQCVLGVGIGNNQINLDIVQGAAVP